MFRRSFDMAEITTKPKPVTMAPATHLGIPEIHLADVVARTSQWSDGILKSLETGERAAIGAVGEFVTTVEDALPQEVVGTAEVAKRITESGVEMTDRLVHTQFDVLRHVIHTTVKSLSSHDGAGLKTA
jgi:hypothetical protein